MPNDHHFQLPSVVASLPHLDQYFGAWCIDENTFRGIASTVRGMDLGAHIATQQATETGTRPKGLGGYYTTADGVAIIDITGAMTKRGSSLSDLQYGTLGVRKAVRDATRADDVCGILLRIDSPGGTVAGTSDLADEVARASAVKPVTAYIEDMGASAAYWVASQATRLVANKSAQIGGIGVYLAVEDASQAYEDAGVHVHVVHAGPMKGTGVPGTKITDAQLEDLQRSVDETNNVFLDAVAAGRHMDRTAVDALATGQVHIASQAKALGLIDAVSTISAEIGILINTDTVSHHTSTHRAHTHTAPLEVNQVDSATYAEIKKEFPNAGANFVVKCLDAGHTLDQVRAAYTAELEARAQVAETAKAAAETEAEQAKAEAKTQVETAQAEAAEAKTASQVRAVNVGVQPLATDTAAEADTGNASSDFREAVAAKVQAGMSQHAATRAVCTEFPDLRKAMVDAHNSEHAEYLRTRK